MTRLVRPSPNGSRPLHAPPKKCCRVPRYYKLDECQVLLPELEGALRDALFHKAEYQKADRELAESVHHIRTSGGARVDRSAYLAMRARRDTSTAALKSALE